MPVFWPIALRIAAQRRQGRPFTAAPERPPTETPLDAALQWEPTAGWRLEGDWDAEVRDAFALFKPLLDRGAGDAPWVIAQLGQSLDGCVATHTGDSCFVTGDANLVHLHRLRALCDAVLVGAGTLAADNPRLTTRRVAGPHPVRVVLDPALRAASTAGVFTDGQAPTLWLCDTRHRDEAQARVGAPNVLAVEGLLRADGSPALDRAVAALAARGLPVVFVEGGGVTVSRFIEQRCLDRLHLAVAPVLIGKGRPGLQWPGFGLMRDCLRPPCQVHRMGTDVLWDLDLQRQAAGLKDAPAPPGDRRAGASAPPPPDDAAATP